MQKDLWNYFCQTGKVEDYLAFKHAAATTAETKKRKQIDHAHHETMSDSTGTAGRGCRSFS